MKAAWLHRGQPWPEGLTGQPDYVIGSLGELTGILKLLQEYCPPENNLAV